MKQTYIADAIRTPIGKFRGSLSTIRTDDLAAMPIQELLSRNAQLDPAAIEDVYLGCANQAGEDNRNIARMALLLAGLPYTVPGETINRLCSSGMSAAIHASRAIKADDGEVFVVGGVENMTRGPWVMSKSARPFGNDAKIYDSSFGWRFINPMMEDMYGTEAMGKTAENLAEKFGISRVDQDWFAWQSQMKATAARDSGRLAEEIMPISIPVRRKEPIFFEHDEFIRSNTTQEILAKLRPAFRKYGSVTAGNASGLNDGAIAMLIASEQGLKDHQLKPMARIVSSAVVGVEPRIMGIGPVYASRKALKKAGLTLQEMDIIEINEAFAVQVLSVLQELGIQKEDPRVNPNGGGIALGHPLGMSGTRILQTAAIELQKTQKQYALVTLCVGVGQGYAVVIERA